MRISLVLVVAAACGGSPPAAAPQPVAPEPPGPAQAPATQDAGTGTQPSWTDTSVCSQRTDQYGPVALNKEQATGRYGHGATRFDQVLTGRERAVEVCGPSGELDWLFSTACADGSHPFPDRASAHSARIGSVGAGGRCGSVIDHYRVSCPEQTYDLYMDMYMCGPGEQVGGDSKP